MTTFPEWPTFAEPAVSIGDILGRMHSRVMNQTTYCGIETQKNPCDAWVYTELIWRLRPDVIVEIGNWHGGHLLKLAHFCDSIGGGEVVGIDHTKVTTKEVRGHPRISLVTGDATDVAPLVFKIVAGRSCMVIEDSGHSEWNTLACLRNYTPLIRPGGYMIVEDTIGIEAMSAVETFLADNADFVADRSLEDFAVSWNPSGYLKRL